MDASLANCQPSGSSDYNIRGILLCQFDRLVEANLEHIRLLEKLINPALFEDGVTRLNFILMAVVEAKNVAPLVARISKLRLVSKIGSYLCTGGGCLVAYEIGILQIWNGSQHRAGSLTFSQGHNWNWHIIKMCSLT